MGLQALGSLIVGGWMLVNGILHDIFVLSSHRGKKYDRELLRLLMDGQILIMCGVMLMIAFTGLKHNQTWGYWIGIVACISALVYCAMIFPFLKSVVTILLNSGLLILLIVNFFRMS